jgi:hypothetical protein
MYALNTPPLAGAQWTGIVTQIAISMLESGKVEAVVCVQSDEHDRFSPKPARPMHLVAPHAWPLVLASWAVMQCVSPVCRPSHRAKCVCYRSLWRRPSCLPQPRDGLCPRAVVYRV